MERERVIEWCLGRVIVFGMSIVHVHTINEFVEHVDFVHVTLCSHKAMLSVGMVHSCML